MKTKRIISFLLFVFINLILLFVFANSGILKTKNNFNATPLRDEVILPSSLPLEINDHKIYTASSRIVRVYFPKEEKVKNIDVEEYVSGVLLGEMYASSHSEALKAVAVAARTYTLYMMEQNKDLPYDVVADPSISQAYISEKYAVEAWGDMGGEKINTMRDAVEKTKGEVLTFDDKIICAVYHASSYPSTENSENVFIESLEYLDGTASAESLDSTYRSTVEYSEEEFNKILSSYGFPDIELSSFQAYNMKNENERCKFLFLHDENVGFSVDGRRVREIFSLNSTSFEVSVNEYGVKFDVYGFGHGVGLSQNGADIMAKSGNNYELILKTYYSGVEISKTIYNQ